VRVARTVVVLHMRMLLLLLLLLLGLVLSQLAIGMRCDLGQSMRRIHGCWPASAWWKS
jgi:hypothetical protein